MAARLGTRLAGIGAHNMGLINSPGRAKSAAAGGADDVVTLSGGSVTAFNFGATATAYFWYNQDGTVDTKKNSNPVVQVNASTDWVIPNGSGPGAYRCKYSGMTGDTGDYVGNLSTSYSAISLGNKYLAVRDTTPTGGNAKSITATTHIDDGSVEQDTGSYTLTADREDF